MPSVKSRNGKSTIVLYEQEKKAFEKTAEVMDFCAAVGPPDHREGFAQTAKGLRQILSGLVPPPKKDAAAT